VSTPDHYDKDPSKDNLDAGKSRELRTNVLLGATLAVAAFTGIAAVFLVDWKERGRVAIGPWGLAGEMP
jgi:hypothetical protein